MSDLVERLRKAVIDFKHWSEWPKYGDGDLALSGEAADEIERLRAALEEIKQLETLEDKKLSTSGEIARKALRDKP